MSAPSLNTENLRGTSHVDEAQGAAPPATSPEAMAGVTPWSRWLQRTRDALRSPAPNVAAPVQPVEVLPAAAAEVAPAEVAAAEPAAPPDAPIPRKPKSRNDEDRTTRIYNRPTFDAFRAYAGGKEKRGDEVSQTAPLPSQELDLLLRQLQALDEKNAAAAAASEPDEAGTEVELEVSHITFEELEEFRRSLVNGPPEVSDPAFSRAALTTTIAPPKSLLARVSSSSIARIFHAGMAATRQWMAHRAVRMVVFLLTFRKYLP